MSYPQQFFCRLAAVSWLVDENEGVNNVDDKVSIYVSHLYINRL